MRHDVFLARRLPHLADQHDDVPQAFAHAFKQALKIGATVHELPLVDGDKLVQMGFFQVWVQLLERGNFGIQPLAVEKPQMGSHGLGD